MSVRIPLVALVAALAWGLSSLLPPGEAWRWLLALAALPGLIGLLARLSIPDSPRSLLARAQPEAARAALARVARVNGRTLPLIRIEAPGGPTNVSPAAATASAKSAFSLRKP